MTNATGTESHHSLPAHDVLLMLGTDPRRGITDQEAAERLQRFGANVLPRAAQTSLLKRILAQFHNPLIYVLLAAAAITFVLGEYVDSGVIMGVVLVNAGVGLVQESKALEALESLRSMVRANARLMRGGRQLAVSSEELVPGDLVLLDAGDKVPADLRLVRSDEMLVDESALTGESEAVLKNEVVLPPETRVADRHNMVYAGTLVRTGSGAGVVVATGAQTELGEIHRLVGGATTLETPLTRKIAVFSKKLTVVILGLAAVAFTVGVARGEDAVAMFTAAVALAVGAIPEGLPAAVTVTLAIGVRRMARRQAVIRRLPAVETLGSATVICTDKTGTLTTNQMTVRSVWTPDGSFAVSGTGYAPEGTLTGEDGVPADPGGHEALRWCLVAGTACNDAALSRPEGTWVVNGDPTEAAMKVVAVKAGVSPDDVLRQERVATIPFDSRRQYMATLHELADGTGQVVLLKGAAERVVDRCRSWLRADGTVEPLDHGQVARVVDDLAARGLRVLATARATEVSAAGFTDEAFEDALVLTGLQAMLDPPRPAVSDAITACHRAGIEVKMITGDHAGTAAAIATELGLDHRPADQQRVLTGSELTALPPEEYAEAVAATGVFARVSPEEKLRLVEGLQALGHVVAMTGDGVNDAPALRQADIGIAMGLSGTEVAKDAADMVLLDDDFATIEAAVEEGRGVYDNLIKFIVWTLPTNMGEGLVILVAILLGAALPILPTQILWINMTTAALLGLMLAFEPKEKGLMDRPPRPADQPLMTRDLVTRTLLVSALLVAGAWWVFVSEQDRGASLAEARTAAVNVFVAVQVMYLFSCRSLHGPSWRLGLFSNRWIIGGVTLQLVAQLALTYLPVMNDIFRTAPIDVETWGRILLVAVATMLVVSLDKWWRARHDPQTAPVVSDARPLSRVGR